ncbi:MAG: TetR/AcrR family transcriptional regulator [Solirubrobacterales bacterium]|nr:TetR/AcrR family transcriptional regulator [Solirubrobacterales bacterium]
MRNDVTTPRRPRDEQLRQRLTEQAAALLVARQSSAITLRDLAAALDTSSRMLVHHFGSRDQLITAALAHARRQLLDIARTQLTAHDPHDLRSLVAALRSIVTDPINRPYFRLFDEVNALAQTQPERFPDFGHASVYDWLPQLTQLLAPTSTDDTDARARATLALAVIRGLMLDRNATHEQARIDAAFAVFDAL